MAIFEGFEYVAPPELDSRLAPLTRSLDDIASSVHNHGRRLDGIDNWQGSVEQRLADIEDALFGLKPDTGARPGEIVIDTPQRLAELAGSWEAGGRYVFTKSMTVAIPLVDLPEAMQIRAVDDAAVKISAFISFRADFEMVGGYWRAPYNHMLPKHKATSEGPWDGHRDRMAAHQFVAGGQLLEPVYRKTDLAPGKFWIEGDPVNPDYVWMASLGDPGSSEEPAGVFYAHYPVLLGGAPGVSVENIVFEGGASTGKRGAAKTNDGWTLRKCKFQYSAGPGLQVTGNDITIEDCESANNGQLNYLVHHAKRVKLHRCTSRKGNTKGFNAAWEAGGMKLVADWKNGNEDIEIVDFLSIDDDGPGIWFDINNRRIRLLRSKVVNALAAAVMFEHGFYDGYVEDVRVEGVRPYRVPAQTNTRQDGFVWQSNVFDSEFFYLYALLCYNAGVFKKHTSRGGSGRLKIHRLTGERIVNKVLYIEKMTDSQIMAAIEDGATPADIALWKQPDDIQDIVEV